MSDAFDVIPYEDIKGNWKKLGSGSFGNVYKGTYLGIDVAIKEVLPSNEYDVSKYFEREWRLMKEARHPNVVLYLGLSRAPDGRIFIISEFIENGNLRQYIHDTKKPFPWRLRLSFATDIVRSLAYLHARKCIHRDLKGENLLVTSNGRLKITDFGFARIAARNSDESKRLTFCGTDSYMSPEILLTEQFDLPTDIFSLGIILCEISARQLADDHHFKRWAPTFGIDAAEVHKLASPGCPPAFLTLAIDCLRLDSAARPTTRVILERLRDIEAEVLLRPSEADDLNVGSVKFMTGTAKRPGAGLRIPSFGVGVGRDIKGNSDGHEDNSDEEELIDAIRKLDGVDLNGTRSTIASCSTDDPGTSTQPLLDNTSSTYSEYSTTVIKSHSPQTSTSPPPSLSSILTIRPSPNPNETPDHIFPPISSSSVESIDSYHTANLPSTMAPSTAAATDGCSSIRSLPMVHRFTLIKPGAKRQSGTISPSGIDTAVAAEAPATWNPLDLLWSSGLLVSKCDICFKRLGWKPVLECDDCGLRAHLKCGEVAPRDCGLRPTRPAVHQVLSSASPLSKIKQNAKSASPSRR